MAAHGFTAIAYDIDYGAGCDLLDARIRLDLTRFVKQHRSRIALIWLGTPCTYLVACQKARRWPSALEGRL